MQYTKPMVDLVYEIRRRVDAELKPGVKMANPELLKELAEYHQQSKDTICKALIKELLFMAGPEWLALLEPAASDLPPTPELPRQVVKVYRGQTILEEAPREPGAAGKTSSDSAVVRTELIAPPPVAEKPVRMYRGHPIL